MNALVTISVPGAGRPLRAVQYDGKAWASAKHVCEALGIDWSSQSSKLRSKAWATVAIITTVGTDGKRREMSMIDRQTLTMWLATIDTSRVSEQARPVLEAYQKEAADALDKYFHEGGVINPRASEHQVNALIRKDKTLSNRMRNYGSARGITADIRNFGECSETPRRANCQGTQGESFSYSHCRCGRAYKAADLQYKGSLHPISVKLLDTLAGGIYHIDKAAPSANLEQLLTHSLTDLRKGASYAV